MRTAIRKMIHATNVIDHAYLVKGRSMAVKPNMFECPMPIKV